MQHITGRVDHFTRHSDGIHFGDLTRLSGCGSAGQRSSVGVEDCVHQPSLRKRETIPAEGCHVFLLRIVLLQRLPEVWTWRWSGTRVSQAPVVLKGIRAWGRLVLNICADRRPERRGNLHRRVASNDVTAEHIATLRRRRYENTIQVSADFVLFD